MPPSSPLPSKYQQLQRAIDAGQLETARLLAQRLLAASPRDRPANEAMRHVLTMQGQHAAALYYARRVLADAPDDPDALGEMGMLLSATKAYDEAIAHLERSLARNPDNGAGHLNLVATLLAQERVVDAERAARRGLEHVAGEGRLLFRLAACLLESARADECAALLSRSLFDDQGDVQIAMFIATVQNYVYPADGRRLVEVHRNFGRVMDLIDRTPRIAHAPARPLAGRRVRLGVLSGDFRSHSCAYFLEPLLDRLDRAAFEPYLYMFDERQDEYTSRFRELALRDDGAGPGVWRQVHAMPEDELARRIAADDLDVLIDIAGLTAGNRMRALRLKPARKMVSYLGYPSTTGLPTMDARIVDSITDPPGSDWHATERLVRLDPSFVCYRPRAQWPAVEPGPMGTSGRVTFGSFNAMIKLNDGVIGVWSRVLQRVPGSRLVLKNRSLRDPGLRDAIARRFEARGVDRSRIECLRSTDAIPEHLAMYAKMDIALDTFPYGGTTTTLEALHMGVPVVTLARDDVHAAPHAERVGASILTNVGLPELVAGSEEAYVEIAAKLAADAARVASLRASLRQRLAGSVLCDEVGFARRFEKAIMSVITDA